MKTHLNLAASDIGKSVEFYATLLDAQPAKVYADYALFITEQPALELALDASDAVLLSRDAHYGVVVETVAEVDRAIERFARAGYATSVEREETCCYANQTKVWASDPDGRRWEVYTVHDERDDRDSCATECCEAS